MAQKITYAFTYPKNRNSREIKENIKKNTKKIGQFITLYLSHSNFQLTLNKLIIPLGIILKEKQWLQNKPDVFLSPALNSNRKSELEKWREKSMLFCRNEARIVIRQNGVARRELSRSKSTIRYRFCIEKSCKWKQDI